MAAPGCLLVVLLPLLGGLLGHWLGGNDWMVWGLLAGLMLGLLVGSGLVWLMMRLKRS